MDLTSVELTQIRDYRALCHHDTTAETVTITIFSFDLKLDIDKSKGTTSDVVDFLLQNCCRSDRKQTPFCVFQAEIKYESTFLKRILPEKGREMKQSVH